MKFSMMKNKKSITRLSPKGFTILELLMVMLMITLLIAMVLVGFSRAKKNVNDDELLANLDLVRLGLEQYHSQCKVYPDQLDRTANNGYPGSPLCPVTLNDFWFLHSTFHLLHIRHWVLQVLILDTVVHTIFPYNSRSGY